MVDRCQRPLQSCLSSSLSVFVQRQPLPWACAWNVDPSVHRNATGEIIAVTVPPVVVVVVVGGCYSPSVGFQCMLQWSEFLQWHSSVGQFQLSFSSGVPVYPALFARSPSGIPLGQPVVFRWHSSVHWTSQFTLAQGKGIGIDTNIKVIVVSFNDLGSSPQPEGEARGLWWASHVVNETTMTEIELSISIPSWWINKYCQFKFSNLFQTVPGYSMVTCAHLGVMWPDCFSLVTRVATAVMSQ